jgi:hypothetical protein
MILGYINLINFHKYLYSIIFVLVKFNTPIPTEIFFKLLFLIYFDPYFDPYYPSNFRLE